MMDDLPYKARFGAEARFGHIQAQNKNIIARHNFKKAKLATLGLYMALEMLLLVFFLIFKVDTLLRSGVRCLLAKLYLSAAKFRLFQ